MDKAARNIITSIREMNLGDINIMEVCGTHTMSIAKAGIKTMLPSNVHLISGPGCPVCVTPKEIIDEILKLSEKDNLIITTYGDMLKVPGSVRGDSLASRKALGADVRIVYSPMDALKIAKDNKDKEVVFLGVGFETTAPGTAMCIKEAYENNLDNFSVLPMLKKVKPSIYALKDDKRFNVQGFLCPGHVAIIIGEDGLRFISDDLKIPAVIAGFESEDILLAIYKLCLQIKDHNPHLENAYQRMVSKEGNLLALKMLDEIFEPVDDIWRGLGYIKDSGFGIKEKYAKYDAKKKYNITYKELTEDKLCKCGDVIKGLINPSDCPMFGKVCTPSDPIGPCMVSSEGSCAAMYKYGDFE